MSRDRQNKRKLLAESNLHAIPVETLAIPQERGFIECPCPKDCCLHGQCLLCTAYHSRKGRLPRCER